MAPTTQQGKFICCACYGGLLASPSALLHCSTYADGSCRYVGQEQFFGKIIVEYGAYFLASYFAIGVVFDTFTLGVLAASAVQYSTNTEAFMAAVKEVAGASKRGPNINVVEKAQTAVNAVKVASALNQISGLLKVSIPAAPQPAGMVSNPPFVAFCKKHPYHTHFFTGSYI